MIKSNNLLIFAVGVALLPSSFDLWIVWEKKYKIERKISAL